MMAWQWARQRTSRDRTPAALWPRIRARMDWKPGHFTRVLFEAHYLGCPGQNSDEIGCRRGGHCRRLDRIMILRGVGPVLR